MRKNITIGTNVKIEIDGDSLYISEFDGSDMADLPIEDNVTIGDNVTIKTKKLHIGFGSVIEGNSKILCKESFEMGDNSFIGHDAKILVPEFKCGDYVELHNHLFCNGEQSCIIGSNVWVGQNCILNARAKLTIGNGVGIGTYSMVWTHGMHGELLEGCTIYKVAPVVIEDDAWLVGAFNVVATGLTVGKKAIILSGSQLTKNIPPNTVWAGSPAVDITAKLKTPPYKEITVDEKYEMMHKFVSEFYDMYPEYRGLVHFIDTLDKDSCMSPLTEIIITKENKLGRLASATVFDLSTKTYNKRLKQIEIDFIKSLLYEKARFLPL